MTVRGEELFVEALELPLKKRAELAEKLFTSLDLPTNEIDEAWAKEAEDRIDAYDRGEITGIPAEEVFKKIDSQKSHANNIS